MKTLRLSLLAASMALGAGLTGHALAQDQAPAGGHIKLNTQVPEPTGSRVQTDLYAQPLVTQTPAPTPAAPQAPTLDGLPRLGDDTLKAAPAAGTVPAPGIQAPAPAADAPEPLTKNFVPGQPVPTYATLQDAAAAGVDPLPEVSLQGVEAAAPTNASSTPAWLSWVPPGVMDALRQLSKQPLLLLGGLGGLALLLALRRVRANRGQSAGEQDDE